MNQTLFTNKLFKEALALAIDLGEYDFREGGGECELKVLKEAMVFQLSLTATLCDERPWQLVWGTYQQSYANAEHESANIAEYGQHRTVRKFPG